MRPKKSGRMSLPPISVPRKIHDEVVIALNTDGMHRHRNGPYLGSISDYEASAGSTCNGVAFPGWHMIEVDGALIGGDYPQFPKATQELFSWSSRTAMKNIVDGTTQTLLCGEVTKRSAENRHAFNGDRNAGKLVGELRPFAQDSNSFGFGGAHATIVQCGMVDGSVQTLQRDIDPAVLDRMASRDGEEFYDINGNGQKLLVAYSFFTRVDASLVPAKNGEFASSTSWFVTAKDPDPQELAVWALARLRPGYTV